MRASQRNNLECVELLLNETCSELNGSKHSAYTPLWFGVSNGFVDLVKLLLDYNAIPSINDKQTQHLTANARSDYRRTRNALPIAVQPDSNAFLFSPIRASIVYSQESIMNHLLKFNANVYELFGEIKLVSFKPKLNEELVNALKFFYRQFGTIEQKNNLLFRLNEFIEDVNIWRLMLVEFVKYILINLKLNSEIIRLDQFLTPFSRNSTEYVAEITADMENGSELKMSQYLTLINEFIESVNLFLSSEQVLNNQQHILVSVGNRREYNEFLRDLLQKPNYHKNLIEFACYLVESFYRPKSLKQLCRFKIRKIVFDQIDNSNIKYNKQFLKTNHMEAILNTYKLPNYLRNYVLCRE